MSGFSSQQRRDAMCKGKADNEMTVRESRPGLQDKVAVAVTESENGLVELA